MLIKLISVDGEDFKTIDDCILIPMIVANRTYSAYGHVITWDIDALGNYVRVDDIVYRISPSPKRPVDGVFDSFDKQYIRTSNEYHRSLLIISKAICE